MNFDLFKVPIILDANCISPFRQVIEAHLQSLSDTMMLYIPFQNIVNDQQDVRLMFEQNASNMITCIDTSLQETPSTRLIESIRMPLKSRMITFRSNRAPLDQKSIETKALKSITDKMLFGFNFHEDEKPVSTQVTVKIMDISWMLRGSDDFLKFVPILESCKIDKLY